MLSKESNALIHWERRYTFWDLIWSEMKKSKNSTSGRPTHAVEFRAEVDGVAKLIPTDFHSFIYVVKCTQCGLARDGVRCEDEDKDVEGSRGTASFVMNCKDCRRQCRLSYTESNFEIEGADYFEWQRILLLDCRGCTVESVHCDNWRIISESGAEFPWNGSDDFFEYDEDLEKPVTVSNLTFRVVPV
jgi:hypothetical protein